MIFVCLVGGRVPAETKRKAPTLRSKLSFCVLRRLPGDRQKASRLERGRLTLFWGAVREQSSRIYSLNTVVS